MMHYNEYHMLGTATGEPAMDRARKLQTMLNRAYEQADKPDLSWSERRELDKKIIGMEKELEGILGDTPQSYSAGRYYTSHSGLLRPSGTVAADPALVLGSKDVDEKKKPLPWILLGLAAAGAATYFTIQG